MRVPEYGDVSRSGRMGVCVVRVNKQTAIGMDLKRVEPPAAVPCSTDVV